MLLYKILFPGVLEECLAGKWVFQSMPDKLCQFNWFPQQNCSRVYYIIVNPTTWKRKSGLLLTWVWINLLPKVWNNHIKTVHVNALFVCLLVQFNGIRAGLYYVFKKRLPYTRKLGLGAATLKILIPFSTNKQKIFCLKIYFAMTEKYVLILHNYLN